MRAFPAVGLIALGVCITFGEASSAAGAGRADEPVTTCAPTLPNQDMNGGGAPPATDEGDLVAGAPGENHGAGAIQVFYGTSEGPNAGDTATPDEDQWTSQDATELPADRSRTTVSERPW